ncbi:hypothetical protein MP228_010256 [Amoeboaphelidium protococcarum]|nr:hypothetical protein MP228_010256 [Amoeboaphelidium protococcarum]
MADDSEGFIDSSLNVKPGKIGQNPTTISGGGYSNSQQSSQQQQQQSQQPTQTLNTLDEPISETFKRDFGNIGKKIKLVLLPTGQSKAVLKDWDLWGPLLMCLLLASMLGFRSSEPSTVFTGVFFIYWCGAAVVTLNANLLGGKISFFQSVCILGYCLFPIIISAIIVYIIPLPYFIRAIIVAVCFLWSTFASVGFLGVGPRLETGGGGILPISLNMNSASLQVNEGGVAENRRLLALYPVCLFYFVVGWIVFVG